MLQGILVVWFLALSRVQEQWVSQHLIGDAEPESLVVKGWIEIIKSHSPIPFYNTAWDLMFYGVYLILDQTLIHFLCLLHSRKPCLLYFFCLYVYMYV